MDHVREALAAIEAQQSKLQQHSAPWMVAEQLKDICRREPAAAELIVQDLAIKEMSVVEAEKKIKAYADANKAKDFSCVTPAVAEDILREFYGLPPAGEEPEQPAAAAKATVALDLEDFL